MARTQIVVATRLHDDLYQATWMTPKGGILTTVLTQKEYEGLAIRGEPKKPAGEPDAEWLGAVSLWQWDTPSGKLEKGCVTTAFGKPMVFLGAQRSRADHILFEDNEYSGTLDKMTAEKQLQEGVSLIGGFLEIADEVLADVLI